MLFAMTILVDQLSVIAYRQTTLDDIKNFQFNNKRREDFKRHAYTNFELTFGGPPGIKWFLPFAFIGKHQITHD